MQHLSDYQKATLQALGIQLWNTREADSESREQTPVDAPSASSSASAGPESLRAVLSEAAPTVAKPSSAQEETRRKPESILADREDVFVQKVLGAAAKVGVDKAALVWRIDDGAQEVTLVGTELTTPALDTLQQSEALKKSLWQQLKALGRNVGS